MRCSPSGTSASIRSSRSAWPTTYCGMPRGQRCTRLSVGIVVSPIARARSARTAATSTASVIEAHRSSPSRPTMQRSSTHVAIGELGPLAGQPRAAHEEGALDRGHEEAGAHELADLGAGQREGHGRDADVLDPLQLGGELGTLGRHQLGARVGRCCQHDLPRDERPAGRVDLPAGSGAAHCGDRCAADDPVVTDRVDERVDEPREATAQRHERRGRRCRWASGRPGDAGAGRARASGRSGPARRTSGTVLRALSRSTEPACTPAEQRLHDALDDLVAQARSHDLRHGRVGAEGGARPHEVQARAQDADRRQQPRAHQRQHPVRDAERPTLWDRPQPAARPDERPARQRCARRRRPAPASRRARRGRARGSGTRPDPCRPASPPGAGSRPCPRPGHRPPARRRRPRARRPASRPWPTRRCRHPRRRRQPRRWARRRQSQDHVIDPSTRRTAATRRGGPQRRVIPSTRRAVGRPRAPGAERAMPSGEPMDGSGGERECAQDVPAVTYGHVGTTRGLL